MGFAYEELIVQAAIQGYWLIALHTAGAFNVFLLDMCVYHNHLLYGACGTLSMPKQNITFFPGR